MSFKRSFHGRAVLTAFVLGAFAFSLPSAADARRLHDPQVETKVEMHQSVEQGTTKETPVQATTGQQPLSERIKSILNPPTPAKKNPPAPANKKPTDRLPGTYTTAPRTADAILGTAMATEKQCVDYLLSNNPHPNISVSPEVLVSYYYKEGAREGVRPDVAFAQALKETGFFRYGGTVTPDQNNYCGLGTTSATVKGAYFASSELGVRAHIQHLLAYASTRRPVTPLVDPRYDLVRSTYGARTLDTWTDLNGRWAVPGQTYGQSIMQLFRDILRQ